MFTSGLTSASDFKIRFNGVPLVPLESPGCPASRVSPSGSCFYASTDMAAQALDNRTRAHRKLELGQGARNFTGLLLEVHGHWSTLQVGWSSVVRKCSKLESMAETN